MFSKEDLSVFSRQVQKSVKQLEMICQNLEVKSPHGIKTTKRFNETNILIKAACPLLQFLGWDIYSDEVLFEAPVWISPKNPKRIEIALLTRENMKFRYLALVEVKVKHRKIGDNHNDGVKGVFTYMKPSKTSFGIVVDSLGIEFHQKGSTRDSAKYPTPVFLLKFQDLPKYPQVLSLISKNILMNKGLSKVIKEVNKGFGIHVKDNFPKYAKVIHSKGWQNSSEELKIIRLNYLENYMKRFQHRW